ncbi:hypothetical protein J4403_00870 [Candidatus Woesearchaeota archaeon]|nr:hypothetical protein [Candidatus Woesearchaeota archaeon]
MILNIMGYIFLSLFGCMMIFAAIIRPAARNLYTYRLRMKATKKLKVAMMQAANDLKGLYSRKPEPFVGLLELFQITSPLQDLINQVGPLLNKKQGRKLEFVIREIRKAGRCEYGINRTRPGQDVTPDKVFLGDIYGLFTLPMTKWIEDGWNHPAKTSTYCGQDLNFNPIYEQAKSFFNSYAFLPKAMEEAISQ